MAKVKYDSGVDGIRKLKQQYDAAMAELEPAAFDAKTAAQKAETLRQAMRLAFKALRFLALEIE